MPNQTMVYSCSGAEQEYTMVWFGIFLYFLIFSLKIRFCEQSVFAKSPLPCCSFCIETAPRLPYILEGSSSGIQFEFEYFHCAYYLWQGPSMISKICNWTLWNRFKGKEVQTFYQQKSNRRFFERALKVASKYILGLLLWIHLLAILV